MKIGAIGSFLSIMLAIVIAGARMLGYIEVPGYAATMLAVLILGALNLFGLGLVGTYAWRSYENSKQRPLAVIAAKMTNQK
jgi:polyisoprenyl-phosphate glycosyltransferase